MRSFLLTLCLGSFLLACGPAAPANDPGSAAPPEPGSASGTAPAAGEGPPGSKVSAQGGVCGGIAGFACAPGLYCSFPPDAMCGAADQTGSCAPVPEMCTEEYAPVCGCDDKTYPNPCYAARASVSVVKKGECAPAPAAPAPAPAGAPATAK